jgi:hypothetical protein
MPGNDTRRSLAGFLEFSLGAVPEALWAALDAFVPPMNPLDSMMMLQLNRTIPRDQRQPVLPLTFRLDGRGGVLADSTIATRGRAIRVKLERLDTVSIGRPY